MNSKMKFFIILSIFIISLGVSASFAADNSTDSLEASDNVALEIDDASSDEIIESSNDDVLSDGESLAANFTNDVSDGVDSLTVKFTDNSAGDPINWFWDFGDGTNDTEQNTIHTYTGYGLYNVSLTVKDNNGNTNTITKNNLIQVAYKGDGVFTNPTFLTGTLNKDIIGWENNGKVSASQRAIDMGGYYQQVRLAQISAYGSEGYISQIIDFDTIDKINFKVLQDFGDNKFYVLIDDEVNEFSIPEYSFQASSFSLDVSQKTGKHKITFKASSIVNLFCLEVELNDNVISKIDVSGFENTTDNITVNFKDASTGYITNWLWDFGDGTTSTEQNPTHTYDVQKTYNVTLTVNNRDNTNNNTRSMVIGSLNSVNFTNNATTGIDYLTVQFTDTSDGLIDNWLWDFGDGFTSTEQNPVHTYYNVGIYDVTLTISNDLDSKTIKKSGLISVVENVVPYIVMEVYQNTPISFIDDSTGNPTSWFWDFGDGTNSTEQNPTHIFTDTGKYTVSLNASNIANSAIAQYVVNVRQFIDIDFTQDGTRLKDNYNDDANTKKLTRYWDLGDGSPIIIQKSRSIVLPGPGQYDVTLTIFNGVENFTVTKTVSYYAVNHDLYVDTFDESADGWTLSENANWTSGQIRMLNSSDYIEKTFNFDDIDFFTFDISASYYVGADFYIDGVKAGSAADGWGGSRATTARFNAENVYGEHTVRIVPHTENDDRYRYMVVDNFRYGVNHKQIANFEIESSEITDEGVTVTFKDISTGTINGWLWDFRDGNTSDERNPTHTFQSGNYKVTLTIFRDGISVDNCYYELDLTLPSINGTAYPSIQAAIDAAKENDTIDIYPVLGGEFAENLQINKSVTLNFVGVVLNAKDTDAPLFNVTDGATLTVNNIAFSKDGNEIVSDENSKVIITDSIIANNVSIDGNVELVENILISGVTVNGGKSRIFNNTLVNCDVAITQTAGELDIISNLITDNAVGINITGGKANIEYNIIFNNEKFSLVYVGDDVANNNNWWGNNFPKTMSGENLSDDYYDIYRLGDGGIEFTWLELAADAGTPVMGAGKEYAIALDLTSNSDGEKITGYLKTFALDFTSDGGKFSDSAIIENGVGQVILTTIDKELANVNITTLGENYPIGDIVVNPEIIITYDGDLVPGEKLIVNVEIPYATGNVTIIVNGDKNTTELVDNNATYTIDKLVVGSYDVIVLYAGDDIFNSAYKLDSFDVVKSTEDLINELNETIAGKDAEIDALNKTVNNQSGIIAGKDVEIDALNKTVNDQAGVIAGKDAEIDALNKTVNDQVGVIAGKDAEISVLNETVKNQSSTIESQKALINTLKGTVVNKKATKITAPKKTFKAKTKTKKVKVKLTSGKTVLKNKKVTLKVKGKTYTVKTNKKGIATFKIKNLKKKGTFKYTVKFAGDKAYKAISKKGKIIVK